MPTQVTFFVKHSRLVNKDHRDFIQDIFFDYFILKVTFPFTF